MPEILLMEDSAPLRRILTRYLRDAGYNVTGFDNGAASGDSDLLEQADILVTDLSMPHVDGRQVIQNIRSLRPDLPVIVITGEENIDDFDVMYADGILRKPFDESALLKVIDSSLKALQQPVRETVNEYETQNGNEEVENQPSAPSGVDETVRGIESDVASAQHSLFSRIMGGLRRMIFRR